MKEDSLYICKLGRSETDLKDFFFQLAVTLCRIEAVKMTGRIPVESPANKSGNQSAPSAARLGSMVRCRDSDA
jgi:hypothetical protein